jgi:hypothetical protein
MYNEAKVGANLGFILRLPTSEMRFGGGYYLKKRLEDFNPSNGAKITHIVAERNRNNLVLPPTTTEIVSIYDNLEQEITPYFLYTGNFGKFTAGVKVMADIRINKYDMKPESGPISYGDYEMSAQEVYVRPELDFGGTFSLLPGRFALHAGFGLNLHTFRISQSDNKSLSEDNTSLEEILPSTRFAVGFTVNLTANISLDMLLITSGKFDFKNEPDYDDISSLRKAVRDNDKFTLFLTMKR